jgi:hypothetical protein
VNSGPHECLEAHTGWGCTVLASRDAGLGTVSRLARRTASAYRHLAALFDYQPDFALLVLGPVLAATLLAHDPACFGVDVPAGLDDAERAWPDVAASPPEEIAQAIGEQIAHPVSYRLVETDGAARAAALIAEMA